MATQYKVENMKCNDCVTTVKDVLDDLPGSNAVCVDLASGIAEVNGEVDSEEAEKVVAALGYSAKKIQ